MLRKLLTVVLPIALPFLVWAAYVWAARWKANRKATGAPLPSWANPPWGWLILAGALLVAASLIAARFLADGDILVPRG
ncbi:MAG: hypothetical protein WD100_01105 [Tistlia sp.]|uniref:hypothetical protein n=1 Tax=Tistlia sp. TaxID=3057121 RepID=UPI0034A352CE